MVKKTVKRHIMRCRGGSVFEFLPYIVTYFCLIYGRGVKVRSQQQHVIFLVRSLIIIIIVIIIVIIIILVCGNAARKKKESSTSGAPKF